MSTGDLDVAAPIAAVTVYPDRARITRRATLELPAGEHRLVLDGLPLSLMQESVRASGTGPATILGVDVLTRPHAVAPDTGRSADLEVRLRAIRRDLAALADADSVEAARDQLLRTTANRSGTTLARALAEATIAGSRLAEVADLLADQLTAVAARRRELSERSRTLTDEQAAVERELAARRNPSARPDRRAIAVTVASTGGDLRLDVSYLIDRCGWNPVYDVRVSDTDERARVTAYALIRQHTGEDWPLCELSLSTARPAAARELPDLDPWYVEVYRPQPVVSPAYRDIAGGPVPFPMMAAPAGPPPAQPPAQPTAAAPVAEATATASHTVTAVTYTPARPVAVPTDGDAHRATLVVVDLPARLDHRAVPAIVPEAHLRATIVNTGDQTLLPGACSVFLDGEYVGDTRLPLMAASEEVELPLGVDDRVRVECELIRRATGKAVLGSTRRLDAAYRITVTNHARRPIRVEVQDRIPVSRDETVSVRDVRVTPEPVERTELGVLTWRFSLDPGTKVDLDTAFRVEYPRGVTLSGWLD
jgi:uncharacterized protein (TIGR02231 family)